MGDKGAETMLSIKEIKKACEFAEGYEWGTNNPVDHYLRFTIEKDRELVFLDSKTFKYIYYPLFLQRVIEGINSHFAHNDKGWFISQSPSIIKAYGYGVVNVKDWVPIARFTFDNAKEEAIRYILAKL